MAWPWPMAMLASHLLVEAAQHELGPGVIGQASLELLPLRRREEPKMAGANAKDLAEPPFFLFYFLFFFSRIRLFGRAIRGLQALGVGLGNWIVQEGGT